MRQDNRPRKTPYAGAAADTLTALLLLVNDGVSRKAAINAVAAITREAMDRYGEAEK